MSVAPLCVGRRAYSLSGFTALADHDHGSISVSGPLEGDGPSGRVNNAVTVGTYLASPNQ